MRAIWGGREGGKEINEGSFLVSAYFASSSFFVKETK